MENGCEGLWALDRVVGQMAMVGTNGGKMVKWGEMAEGL
jgi:hypothetical protein